MSSELHVCTTKDSGERLARLATAVGLSIIELV